MLLQSKRDRLLRELDDARVRKRILPEWNVYRPLITAWWDRLKAEDADDTVAGAFHARRLVLRYIKSGESKTVDMSANHGAGGMKKDVVPRPTVIDPTLIGVKRMIAEKNAATKPQFFKLGLGAKELVARTVPANFGQSRRTKVPDPDVPGTLKKLANTAQIIQRRKDDAINYHAILTGAFTVNEITVAFRHHNGIFPLFGVWAKARGLFIEKRMVDSLLTATRNTIADKPLAV